MTTRIVVPLFIFSFLCFLYFALLFFRRPTASALKFPLLVGWPILWLGTSLQESQSVHFPERYTPRGVIDYECITRAQRPSREQQHMTEEKKENSHNTIRSVARNADCAWRDYIPRLWD